MKTVAVIVQDGFAPFEFGVACEAFGLDRTDDGIPNFDFRIVTPNPGVVQSKLGFSLNVDNDLAFAYEADLVVVSPTPQRVVGAHRPARARRRPARGRPRRVAAERLQRVVHPRSGRSPGRAQGDDALDVRRPHGRDVPVGRGRPERAVRAGRPHHHERRDGRGAGCVPAPAPPGARRRDDQHDRPAHGRAAAARRRPGAVHPASAARSREPLARAGHGLDDGEPAQRAHGRPARGEGAHVAAHVRPPVQGRLRHDARGVARTAAHHPRAAPARADRPRARPHRRTSAASDRHPSCGRTSRACWGRLPPRTARRSAARSEPAVPRSSAARANGRPSSRVPRPDLSRRRAFDNV